MEVVIFRSDDGGQSWSRPTSAFPRGQPYDHPVLSVGDDGSIVVFATGEPFGSLSLTSSKSGSLSFSPWPSYRPDSSNNNLGSGVVLSDGTPVFSYYSMSVPQPSALWAIHSRTNGLGYERALITREHIPVGFPMMAVDRSDGPKRDRVYSVWVRSNAEPHVMIGHSDDFGVSWSDPVRVHTDSSASSRTLPYVAVNDVGVVAVAWIDGRHHEGSCWDVYATASLDGGATFLPERRITPETSCPNVTGNGGAGRRWRWGGDYIGMTSDANGAFHVIWSDSRTGVYQNWIARLTIAAQREE